MLDEKIRNNIVARLNTLGVQITEFGDAFEAIAEAAYREGYKNGHAAGYDKGRVQGYEERAYERFY